MVFLLLLLSLLIPAPAWADSEFISTKKINYHFSQNGDVLVNQQIQLSNKYSTIYPKEYQLTVYNHEISQVKAYDSQGNILQQIDSQDDKSQIYLKFNNPSINTQKSTDFQIDYQIKNLAQDLGNIKKVDLPKHVIDSQDQISIQLDIPQTWGDIVYSSINISGPTQDGQYSIYQISNLNAQENISIAFGKMQLFNFNLSYELKNDQSIAVTKSIPIPPDTDTQTIVFDTINPPPQEVTIDPDGNYLAQYTLTPNQSIQIIVSGQAQIHPSNPSFPHLPPQDFHTQESHFWPSDPTFSSYAKSLKTPNKIFDFVVDTLDYNVNQITSAVRKNPLQSLKNPQNSLCTDFTDLFISIARAANIPSREIQGYVYNQKLPTYQSNIAPDILHAWPQYWNQTAKKWQSIDPTWQKTSHGTDYFNTIDLNRLIFVIHGQDSQNPPAPGSYKSNPQDKTVVVTPSNTLKEGQFAPILINLTTDGLVVKNPNYQTITNLEITDGGLFSQNVPILPPLSTISLDSSSFNNFSSILSKNKDITFSLQADQLQTNTQTSNPYFIRYRLLVLFSSLLVLGGIIILIKIKWSKNS